MVDIVLSGNLAPASFLPMNICWVLTICKVHCQVLVGFPRSKFWGKNLNESDLLANVPRKNRRVGSRTGKKEKQGCDIRQSPTRELGYYEDHSSEGSDWGWAVLAHLGCYNKNYITWAAYKQHTFISPISGGEEVQDQGVDRVST